MAWDDVMVGGCGMVLCDDSMCEGVMKCDLHICPK